MLFRSSISKDSDLKIKAEPRIDFNTYYGELKFSVTYILTFNYKDKQIVRTSIENIDIVNDGWCYEDALIKLKEEAINFLDNLNQYLTKSELKKSVDIINNIFLSKNAAFRNKILIVKE